MFSTGLESFAEEDGYVPGRGRKRTLFGRRSGEWRYSRDDGTGTSSESGKVSPSSPVDNLDRQEESSSFSSRDALDNDKEPTPLHGAHDVEREGDAQPVESLHRESASTEAMKPFTTLDVTTTPVVTSSYRASAVPTTPQSPRLLPVDSIGLPLVSPLQTREQALNADRFATTLFETSQPLAEEDVPDASPTTESQETPSLLPDFGNDGSALSRQQNGLHELAEAQGVPAQGARAGVHIEDAGSIEEAVSILENGVPYCQSKQSPLIHEDFIPESAGEMLISSENAEFDVADQHVATRDSADDLYDQFVEQSPTYPDLFNPENDQHFQTAALTSAAPIAAPSTSSDDFQPLHTPQRTQSRDSNTLERSILLASTAVEHPLEPLSMTPAQPRPNPKDMLSANEDEASKGDKSHQSPQQPDHGKAIGRSKHQNNAEKDTTPQTVVVPAQGQHQPEGVDNRRNRKSETTKRRSVQSPSRQVPDVISPWFGLRRSSRRRRISRKAAALDPDILPSAIPRKPSVEAVKSAPPSSAKAEADSVMKMPAGESHRGEGSPDPWQTSTALYQPLASLDKHIGVADSQGPNLVDVFVIVADNTSKPVRSKGGPRDHHVVFKITDQSIYPTLVEVQCFRPYARSLPVADVGDVILLREFVVKTRHHSCFLLSAGSSGWAVWRYGKRKQDGGNPDEAGIERAGPPVELADEEQKRAAMLRQWFAHIQGVAKP